jgi:hypothetical protein
MKCFTDVIRGVLQMSRRFQGLLEVLCRCPKRSGVHWGCSADVLKVPEAIQGALQMSRRFRRLSRVL